MIKVNEADFMYNMFVNSGNGMQFEEKRLNLRFIPKLGSSCEAISENTPDVTKNFNQIQCFVLLALVAQITGHKPGKAYHKIVNAHIYENQLELMRDVQLNRQPYAAPSLHINPDIRSLEDIESWVSKDDFKVDGYQSHPAIKYPFAV